MFARHRRARGERGATLVEASIVTPLLLLFVFGIFEFGFAFRDYLGVANTTRDGAREASIGGANLMTDYRTLQEIQKASSALPDDAINRIVIFEAAGPGATVPAGCMSGSVNDVCNHYTPADFARPDTDFGCQRVALGDPLDSPDRFWCPDDREISVSAGRDYIGVFVDVDHKYITGLFGDDINFADTTILQVEPQDV